MKRVALVVLSTAIAGAWLFAPSRAAATHPIFKALFIGRTTHDYSLATRIVNRDPRAVHARDRYNCTPLHYAETAAFARLLIKKGAYVHARGGTDQGTPLMNAAGHGLLDVVKVLVAHGAMVNATNRHGWTALHAACNPTSLAPPGYAARKYRVAAYLLSKGANVNARTRSGHTALFMADLRNWNPPLAALIRRHGGRR